MRRHGMLDFDVFFIDLDGVVFIGETPVAGAREAVDRIRRAGRRVFFLTNNSTLSRGGYVRKLAGMGIRAEPDQILTSGYASAVFLREKAPGARILVVGERGLVEELEQAGLKTVDRAEEATHVVVGLDRRLTYGRLAEAAFAIRSGTEFIATNSDSTYPTERGLAPGAGAIVAALSTSTGRSPVVIGKPSSLMLELGLRLAGVRRSRAVIIGDRLDTDVAAGRAAGIKTGLVLTGVCRRSNLKAAGGPEPDFVFNSLAEVSADEGVS